MSNELSSNSFNAFWDAVVEITRIIICDKRRIVFKSNVFFHGVKESQFENNLNIELLIFFNEL